MGRPALLGRLFQSSLYRQLDQHPLLAPHAQFNPYPPQQAQECRKRDQVAPADSMCEFAPQSTITELALAESDGR